MQGLIARTKKFGRRKLPRLGQLYDRLTVKRGEQFEGKPISDVFLEIYQQKAFGGAESVSGPGSDRRNAAPVVDALPGIITRYNVRSLLDAPCGDLTWMQELLGKIAVDYTGLDIVAPIVEANRKTFGSTNVRFAVADITRDALPPADLMLCRDCLIHLSNELALDALRNIQRSGVRHLLTTTYPSTTRNVDIITGVARRINLHKAPFFLPLPLEIVTEVQTTPGADRSLALFDLSTWRP